jgi:hypothetical protein
MLSGTDFLLLFLFMINVLGSCDILQNSIPGGARQHQACHFRALLVTHTGLMLVLMKKVACSRQETAGFISKLCTHRTFCVVENNCSITDQRHGLILMRVGAIGQHEHPCLVHQPVLRGIIVKMLLSDSNWCGQALIFLLGIQFPRVRVQAVPSIALRFSLKFHISLFI